MMFSASPASDDDSGSSGSEVGEGGDGSGNAAGDGSSNMIAVGVTMQVVYYRYDDCYNRYNSHGSVINTVQTGKAIPWNDTGRDKGETMTTVFDTYTITPHTFIVKARWDSYPYVYHFPYENLASDGCTFTWTGFTSFWFNYNNPGGSASTYPRIVRNETNGSKAIEDYLAQIILGSNYGAWDKLDIAKGETVATDTSLYAATLKYLGASDQAIQNYLDSYHGKLKAQEKTDVTHKQLTIVLGTPERSLNTEALMETILDAYYANDFTPIDFAYDVTEPDQPDLDAIHLEHTIAPVDAVLDETDYSISREVLGYSFDLEAMKQMVAAAGEGQTVTIDFAYTPAAVTWESIDATLFKDVLGSVSTNHTNDANRNTNLKLAAKAINGKLIRPGETFSYNQTLGERTEKKGYKPAGAYMAGKTVETVGGGICQVSSTLYYACLKADLQIVERTAHGYTVSYMPYGMDATVSWGSLDYKFKNNTDYPIRIEAWVSGGQVHVKLIGTDTKDYYVKMTYETVEGPTEGKVVYEDYKWDNKEGYKDGEVLQTAYTGRTVKSYRQKFDKATDKLISSEYEATSRYKSRDKIIAWVEPKPQPTVPPTTAPAETTAP